jgi:ATP-dependent exoDNAse (exonuclease V) beta subunit
MLLIDQSQRDDFAENLDENFSVIAPAGVGKTTAITKRIANFIINDTKHKDKKNSLAKKLVAVTYTEKAAQEMRNRVLDTINKLTECSKELRRATYQRLDMAFIGTIHSFASKFLKLYCSFVGLNSDFSIVQDDTKLWEEFLKNLGDPLSFLDDNLKNEVNSFISIDDILSIARNAQPNCIQRQQIGYPPPVNFHEILKFRTKKGQTGVQNYIRVLQEWVSLKSQKIFFIMPDHRKLCSSNGFISFCDEIFFRLNEWKDKTANIIVSRIADKYIKFRIKNGKLRYDDLINLSIDLLHIPEVIREIESSPYIVLLDEAQDTDKQQFRFLIGVAQHILHDGIATDIGENFPEMGHFSMVGDQQQSIYCGRADLKFYKSLHAELIKNNNARELTFSVTMRCPIEVTKFVNDNFSKIFQDIKFVQLIPKPSAITGSVDIIEIKKSSEEIDAIRTSSLHIANIFRDKTCKDFGVQRWSDIAILAPRRNWLLDINECFLSENIAVKPQLHFENFESNKASILQWVTACLRYINNPVNRFEFAGVLREVFGIKSDEIIKYYRNGGSEICKSIDSIFCKLRKQRFDISLAKFLLKIEKEFKITRKISALGIYNDKELIAQKERFIELVNAMDSNKLTSKNLKDILDIVLESDKTIEEIVKENGIENITDDKEIRETIKKIIEANPESVTDYKNGHDRAIKFLMGQVMKETKGKANPKMAMDILTEELQ